MKLNSDQAHKLWSALSHFGLVSFRPRSLVVLALGHFGLIIIWMVISLFFCCFVFLFVNLYHYGRVGQYECVRVVRGGFM